MNLQKMPSLEEIKVAVLKEFTPDFVNQTFEETLVDYVDSDWEDDGYESEREYYEDHVGNEVEMVIFEDMAEFLSEKFKFKLN